MISNRQGGRRRGRGGGGGRAPNLNTGGGNRQDNRQRGNAAQLLEKYKGLARDMQMQGDRVQTEYYLQFADHYYRVLNENRARFEEQRRQRGDYDAGYDDEDQDEIETGRDAGDDGADETEVREPAEVQSRRENREGRENRENRREANGEMRPRRSRNRRPDESEYGSEDEPSGIAADLLPPAISAGTEGEDEPEARAPRRRARRPRANDDEIAPAA